jgi:hypothetical protein
MAYITDASIMDKIVQREIIADVLTEAQKIANLDTPTVVKSYQIPGLHAQIPLMTSVSVYENVAELASSEPVAASFSSVDIDMKKDRIKLAISDEAALENAVVNAFELQIQSAAQGLAQSMDSQIATALTTTPQAGAELALSTDNVFKTIAAAVALIAPAKVSAMAMTQATFLNILATTELRSAMSVQNADGTITLPGLPNIPVVLSDNIPLTADKDGRILFVSNEVPAAIKLTGAIKTRAYDDESVGATVFQSDVFRAVKSNIKQKGSVNAGVVSVDVMF